ncbi:hypothetical protein ASwh1_387 [Aeromonas phage Aswh_1]|nr:hypothetical protein ASwh1_387 [Aeromonas phage Aswh_1]
MKIYEISFAGMTSKEQYDNLIKGSPEFAKVVGNFHLVKMNHEGFGGNCIKVVYTNKNEMYDGMRDWFEFLDVVKSFGTGFHQRIGHVNWI